MFLKRPTSMIMRTLLIAAALVLCIAGTAAAGTHLLGTPVETNTDITATGDQLRVTIPSTGDKGGNDATSATVSLSGTGLNVSDIASVSVFYGGIEDGRTISPGALTNIPINLPGNTKGGLDWTFYVAFNAGASVTNFVYTVESITGTNNANLPFSTSGATVNVSASNSPPNLAINQPDGIGDSVNAGDPYNIDYDLTDGDSVADVDFYYDTNASGADGTPITGCQNQPEGTGATCSWDTTGLNGDYWVYGIASDPENGPQTAVYSSGPLTVTGAGNTPPALVINQPDGIGDSVNAGDPYNIDYDLTDGDSVADVDFYYDTNASGADGTPITGCQNQPEGTGATCSWDTTGLNGDLYVYGIAADPENGPQTAVYSTGPLSIAGGGVNDPPNDPTGLDQQDLSSVSITPGGTTTEKTVQIQAFLSDTNTGDNLWLEVEFADYAGGAGSFRNTPNCASASTVPGSGGTATAVCSNLTSGVSYMWQARSYDGTAKSNWAGFPPGDPDVTVSNTAPTAPADHNQYKMDGAQAIAQDGVTDETTIKVKATVNDPSDQDDLKLEVEIADYAGGGGSFTGTPNCSGDFVAEGSVATATCKNLIDGTEYMWRARTNDGVTTSAWQDFGTARDVTIARNIALDTMMHNSNNLGQIDYGAGPEDWGVAGGRYGEFVCETCHTAFDGITGNIKRIKDNFTTSDGSSWPSGSPTTNTVIFTDAREGTSEFADNTSPINGVCNVCHTNVNGLHPHWNYLGSSDNHNFQKDCTACHKHVEGFVGSGDCLECHAAGNTVGAPEIEPEFGRNSHHVMKTWASMAAETQGVGSLVCIACHAEGKLNADGTAGLNGTYHNNAPSGKIIDLVDGTDATRTTVFSFNIDDLLAKNDAANTAFDNFCMSCHRVGGAASVGGGNWPAAYTSTNPFGETTNIRTNSYDQVPKDFTQLGGGLAVYEDFLKVYDDSGADNDGEKENHHAVDGARYTTSYLAPTYLSSSVALYDGSTGVVDSSNLHCNDCHSTAYSAHGGNNEYMLQTLASENPGAEHASEAEYVCLKCHVGVPYDDGAAHTSNGSNYIHSAQNIGTARTSGKGHITGILCLYCHDGTMGFGGIHGFPDASYSAGGSGGTYWKRRFLPGAALDSYDPDDTDGSPSLDDTAWTTAGGDGACYTLGGFSSYTACGQHSMSAGSLGARTTTRPVDY